MDRPHSSQVIDLNCPCISEAVARLYLRASFNLVPLFLARIRFPWKVWIFSPTLFYFVFGQWHIGLCVKFGMSTSEGLFFSALQPHTAVSTYAVPNDRDLTVDRQSREKRVQQQVQQRLAEKASTGEARARGTARPARDNFV